MWNYLDIFCLLPNHPLRSLDTTFKLFLVDYPIYSMPLTSVQIQSSLCLSSDRSTSIHAGWVLVNILLGLKCLTWTVSARTHSPASLFPPWGAGPERGCVPHSCLATHGRTKSLAFRLPGWWQVLPHGHSSWGFPWAGEGFPVWCGGCTGAKE